MVMTAVRLDEMVPATETFERILVRWKNLLRPQIGAIGDMRWALRENLACGARVCGDPAVSLAFQTFAPSLSTERVARVFDRERSMGRPVHFELLVALPDAILVTLASRRSWARSVAAADGLSLQLEPSFYAVEEIDEPATWAAAPRRAESSESAARLDRYLRVAG